MSKLEIRQVDNEQGIFTEILIDGHKLDGVRSYRLVQYVGNDIPTLTIDLNALDLATDISIFKINQEGVGNIESIKFSNMEEPMEFVV